MNQMTRVVAAPPDSFKARFTSAEFVQVTSAAGVIDIRLELIDGELERVTPPMGSHVKRQSDLFAALLCVVAGSALTAGVEVGIQLDEDSVVVADAALLQTGVFEARFFHPDEVALAVEVAETTLNRDMGAKRIKYAVAEIAEYWVIDGARSVVHVYREPVDGDYAQIATVRFGEPLAVPGTDKTITLG